jgi:hypothetical protein
MQHRTRTTTTLTSIKQPILTTDRQQSQRTLRRIIVTRQTTIISELGLQQINEEQLRKFLGVICQNAYDGAMARFVRVVQSSRLKPILSITSFLIKDELAQMAETLIHLESFRKQVGLDEETVGGPIDVAVIISRCKKSAPLVLTRFAEL